MYTMYEKIKSLCESKGITITAMCREVGISSNTMTELKSGRTRTLSVKSAMKIANYFNVSVSFLMDDNDETPINDKPDSNITVLPNKKVRMVPLYESVSAGFGVLANDMIVDYIPLFISSDIEASETLCIKVQGNSMYPKIEDGDIVQVQKVASVDSGKIAVVLIDDDDGLVKRVVYGSDWIELQSINPEYPPKRFEGADVQRIRVVGLVKKIIKDC